MKKGEGILSAILISLVIIVFRVILGAIATNYNSEPIKEYSPKYELVSVKTEIITTSENVADVVLVQDIRYTLTYVEDGKFVIFQTYDLNLRLCNEPYIQAIDNWYGGYVGCATKEMMANTRNEASK